MSDNHVDRWAKRITDQSVYQLSYGKSNILTYSNGQVYSYGLHFELGRVLRDAKGKATLVLLNGERYSASTTQHQAAVRNAARKHAPNVPCVVIPFAALKAAGVDFDSIRALDVKPDGTEYIMKTSDLPPKGYEPSTRGTYWGAEYQPMDGSTRHIVGIGWGAQEVRYENGVFSWHTTRHWLGDALISCKVRGRKSRVKMISSFDRNEPSRLYFLCELPRCKATTFEDAIEALKPDAVVIAESMGRECERQGDIFAIPMPGLKLRELKGIGATVAKRSQMQRGAAQAVSLIGTAHTATEVATLPDGTQYIRGCMYHDPQLMGEWRDRDHIRRKLAKGVWHLVQRNTVPVAKGRRTQSIR